MGESKSYAPRERAKAGGIFDGSNVAHEARERPSYNQLVSAVAAFRRKHPDRDVVVVVDPGFAFKVDLTERADAEAALARGELVQTPSGVAGRGDEIVLEIADRDPQTIVVSNDSFKPLQGRYRWLFEPGRLLGAVPLSQSDSGAVSCRVRRYEQPDQEGIETSRVQ